MSPSSSVLAGSGLLPQTRARGQNWTCGVVLAPSCPLEEISAAVFAACGGAP